MILILSLGVWAAIVVAIAVVFELALDSRAAGYRRWAVGLVVALSTVLMAVCLVEVAIMLRGRGVYVEDVIPTRLDGYAAWFTALVVFLVIMVPRHLSNAWTDPIFAQQRQDQVRADQAKRRARWAKLVSHIGRLTRHIRRDTRPLFDIQLDNTLADTTVTDEDKAFVIMQCWKAAVERDIPQAASLLMAQADRAGIPASVSLPMIRDELSKMAEFVEQMNQHNISPTALGRL